MSLPVTAGVEAFARANALAAFVHPPAKRHQHSQTKQAFHLLFLCFEWIGRP
jgi:hypothetical protein